MAVYTKVKDYHTKAHMGMIDVTGDFQDAVTQACEKHHISAGIITGFTTGGVAALTTLEFEPGMVTKDLKEAMDEKDVLVLAVPSPGRKRTGDPL